MTEKAVGDMSFEEAMAELEAHAGTQFDPQVVAAARAAFDDGELPVPDPPT